MTMHVPDHPDAVSVAAGLREPLLARLDSGTRRRSAADLRRPGAAAAVVAGLALAAAVLLPGSGTTPALAVSERDGWLTLRIADATAGPAELTEDLRDAGVRGEVRLLAVPDHLVGTWAVVAEVAGSAHGPSAGGAGEPETTRLDRVEYGRETLRLPVSQLHESTGSFVFYAGRTTEPGEAYEFDGQRFGTAHLP